MSLKALFLLPLLLLASCVSNPLPPRLNADQERRLGELPLPYSVGVARHKYPSHSDGLEKGLRAAGVFRKVAPLESYVKPPDLIATVEEPVSGTAVIPALTFLTLGLVPTVVEEDHGFIFALAPATHRNRRTRVDAHYRGTTTLGWAGLAVSGLPDYTSSAPGESERFRKLLGHRTLQALRPSRISARP